MAKQLSIFEMAEAIKNIEAALKEEQKKIKTKEDKGIYKENKRELRRVKAATGEAQEDSLYYLESKLYASKGDVEEAGKDILEYRAQARAKRQDARRITTGLAIGAVGAAAYTSMNLISDRTGDELRERRLKKQVGMVTQLSGVLQAAIFLSPTAAGVAGAALAVKYMASGHQYNVKLEAERKKIAYTTSLKGISSYGGSR